MKLSVNRACLKPVAYAVGVALAIFQILFTGGFFILEPPLLRGIHLSAVMVLVFLLVPPLKRYKGKEEPVIFIIIDLLLCAVAVAIGLYFYVELDNLLNRIVYVDEVTNVDLVLGTACILLVLEITRRTTGFPLFCVALAFLLYGLFGSYLPASIGHNGIAYDRLIEMQFLLSDGIFGTCLATGATMIFAFIMFGAFLERSNMSSVFMDLACLLTKKSQGGPAKVAIFASALFGTISGSSPANVYSTGIFTIPLMKKVGYTPAFAGAVEAVASTGGQIMPPVMGAAAFIMADLTGLGYLPIATAALLPAVLYYWALLSMIHLEAVRNNLGYLPAELVPDAKTVIRKLYYLLPIVILIAALWMGRSVISSAFFATASIFVISQFSKETRLTFKGVLDALALSSKNAMMISSCCAAAGIIVGVITLTGVGYKFISVITDLAGNNLFLLMLFLAVTCIILGMGVPTAPAYVIVATLGAPALMKAGVPMISAHLFVFYFAILSVITPPVCVTAFAGAAIAEANPMKTGFVSCKLGLVAFIIPFMFVYQPALLLIGSTSEVIMACVSSIVGVIGLAAGLQGYLITTAKIWERPLLFIGGLMMIYPGSYTDMLGLAMIVVVLLMQAIRRRSSGTPSTKTA
ncbi:TRAP transporter permease [uncultured Mailhella sp.]|uniref:TRAP transporter permease n=1 Tax=uncultured Mailhella sp. TaxID=1981031 RepID=UPI0025EFFC53|nr:TRAP transporter permease [uncultured Mailhella sp.]